VIHCFNPTCQAVSTTLASRCHVCGTPLLYRFLLAVAVDGLRIEPGTLVAGRYIVQSPQIWLDTQPNLSVPPLEQIPPFVLAYLRLSELAQHMPRPYAYLEPAESGLPRAILLLDAAPIGIKVSDRDQIEPYLLPTLPQVWSRGTALQQLYWLRQVAALWPPLGQEQVAATLLDMDRLRADQSVVRLATLGTNDQSPTEVTLAQLGRRWQPLVKGCQGPVQAYLGWLSQALVQGAIASASELVAELDQAIQTLAQGLTVAVDWVAYTDQGPARDRNEDACHPNGQVQQQVLSGAAKPDQLPLLIVCDGIGGHEQGNVASETAINGFLAELQPLAQQPELGPDQVSQRLKQAMGVVNDAIVNRNNQEHRSARARMGTTVVVALVHFPYVSVAHLGDSRAYRVSASSCSQITLDDDVASREAHLGYALYSEAVHMSGGGALVQALGISDSGHLYPTVQHLLIDDPSLLLLCSDGLCDYDRVDALWRHTIQPLTRGKGAIQPVAQDLIHQANRLNGHDNVTVGLIRFSPQPSTLPMLPGSRLRPVDPTAVTNTDVSPVAVTAQPKTVLGTVPSAAASHRRGFPWLALILGTVGALAAAGAAVWVYHQRQPAPLALQPITQSWPLAGLEGDNLAATALAITVDISVGSFWQTGSGVIPPDRAHALSLATTPAPAPPTAPGIATGSILQITSRQTAADGTRWIRLQVCSIPSGSTLDPSPLESNDATDGDLALGTPALTQQLAQPGQEGWVLASHLYSTASALESVTLDQGEACQP
jgi:serine/threonine protein phosphatase PrpC